LFSPYKLISKPQEEGKQETRRQTSYFSLFSLVFL